MAVLALMTMCQWPRQLRARKAPGLLGLLQMCQWGLVFDGSKVSG